MPRGNPSGRPTRSARGRREDHDNQREDRHSRRGAIPSSRMPSDRIAILNMETDVDFDYEDDNEDYHNDEARRPLRMRSMRERERAQYNDAELEDSYDEDDIPYDDQPRRQPGGGRTNTRRSPGDRPANRRGNR